MAVTHTITSMGTGAGRDPRVYFAAIGTAAPPVSAGHVYELAWFGGGWHQRDLTLELHTPTASGNLAAMGTAATLDPRVYYITGDGHVHEFAWFGGGWHDRDLTAELHTPAAADTLAAMGTAATLDPRVYYRTRDGHIREMAWFGGWHDRDLTAELHTPAAAGPIAATGAAATLDPRVYYPDTNGHVREFAWSGGAWHDRDLTGELHAPRCTTAIAAMGAGAALDPRVYYTAPDGHVHEYAWAGGGWHHRDLTAELNAPVAAGSLPAMGTGAALDPRVYYNSPNNHMHELAWFGGGWHERDLTAELNAPDGTGVLTAMGYTAGLAPRVYHVPGNLQVHEFAWDGLWNIRNIMPSNQNTLPVPLCPQQTPMWCWAASGEMVMTYLRHPTQQCLEANFRFGRNDCCNDPTPNGCVVGGWPQFDHWGFSSQTVNGALTFDQLQQEINCYRPIAYSWGWMGGGGHMMVARGYNAAGQLVYINDPWPPRTGDVRWITYAAYVSQPNDHVHWTDYFGVRWTGPAGPGGAEQVPGAGEQEEPMGQQNAPTAGNGFGDPQAAAQASLKLFAELVTPETAEAMGFEAAPVDPAALSLDEPLHVFTIPLEEVQAYQAGTDISQVLTDTGQLCYPVLMDGKVVSSVTVGKQDDQWKFVSLGNPNLTKDLVEARNSSAARTGKAPTEYFIVSIPTLYAMFVAHRDEEGKVQFTHVLEEGARRRGVARHATEPGEDVLKELQAQAPARRRGAAPGPRVVPF